MFWKYFILTCAVCTVSIPVKGRSQVVLDGTIPAEVIGESEKIITGGARVDNYLFHSFLEFSLAPGEAAIFDASVVGIIARVTGGNPSTIAGQIAATNPTNFLLMNPAGVIFAPGASLNVGGAFVATDARSVVFPNEDSFSVSGPVPPSMSTLFPLKLRHASGGGIKFIGLGQQTPLLVVQPGSFFAASGDSIEARDMLAIAPGASFALAAVESGNATVGPSGKITLEHLGGEAQSGELAIANSVLSAPESGSLQLVGNSGNLLETFLSASPGDGSRSPGSIELKFENLMLSNSLVTSFSFETEGAGISIAASRIDLLDSSFLTGSFGPSPGGDVSVEAGNFRAAGISNLGIPAGVLSLAFDGGNSGEVSISASSIEVLDGANLSSSVGAPGLFPEGLGVPVPPAASATGEGGRLSVRAESLTVSGTENGLPSLVGSFVAGSGRAAGVTISSDRITLSDGGQITSGTVAGGSAGSLFIQSESLTLSGEGTEISSNSVTAPEFERFGLPAVPSGDTGSVRIVSGTVELRDSAQISVENQGSGDAGTVSIAASEFLAAFNSRISAFAGAGDGGNVEIRAGAIALSDSLVSATSVAGDGGDLAVIARGIIANPGVEQSFDASSELGVSGTVNIDAISFPSSSLVRSNPSPLPSLSAPGCDRSSPFRLNPGSNSNFIEATSWVRRKDEIYLVAGTESFKAEIRYARELVEAGQRREAIAAYRSALDHNTSKVSFAEIESAYKELIEVLVQEGDSQGIKRSILSLQTIELSYFLGYKCSTKIPEIEDSRVIIYSAAISSGVVTVLQNKDGTELFFNAIGLDEVQKDIKEGIESLSNPDNFDYIEKLEKIYQLILGRIPAEALTGSLTFVLDSELRKIPPGALFDGKVYLAEKYSVSLGIGILGARDRKGNVENFQATIAGISKPNLGFPGLPSVAVELESAENLPDAEAIANEEVTLDALRKKTDVFHLSSHGQFSSQPEETFLLAWGERIGLTEIADIIAESGARLAVFSACETAKGDGAAVLGFSGLAVGSGAQWAIGSLWKVNDSTTSKLFGLFYSELERLGEEAIYNNLQKAQRKLIELGYSPYYWAPFVLVAPLD